MDKKQYIVTGSDESYTYKGFIYPILPLIQDWCTSNNIESPLIWCPFDKAESNFVKVLRECGYQVVHSHIETGEDFLEYEPEHFDIIISNPPFKNKRVFLERAIAFGKPFALVNPLSSINDGLWNDLFVDSELQLIIPKRRARFFNDGGCIGSSPSFKSGYICKDFLQGQQIKFIQIENK